MLLPCKSIEITQRMPWPSFLVCGSVLANSHCVREKAALYRTPYLLVLQAEKESGT